MTASKNYDVLIVGCGPTGATLANLLRMGGHSVAIFERDKEIFHAPRAMLIDAQTCRIYQSMGILEKMIPKDAAPFLDHYFVDENRKCLLHLDFRLTPKPEGHSGRGYSFYQPALEAFLRADLNKGNEVDAFYGYEVTEVNGEGDAASLVAVHPETKKPITYTGKFLIGCDGGNSFCRKSMPTERVDFNYKKAWMVIDLIVHDQALWDAQRKVSEYECAPGSAKVWVKGHNNHFRMDIELENKDKDFTREDVLRLISKYIDTSSVEIMRQSRYHFYAGMPDKWRHGRMLLAGDAAHSTPPFAGQGLNMGIRDAANLAFKLDYILKEKANIDFLDTYQEEFWDFYGRLIEQASRTGKMLSLSNPFQIALRNSFFWLLNRSKRLAAYNSKKSNIGAGFKKGFIGNHPIAGDRSIQPIVRKKDGTSCLLDELLDYDFALISTQPCSDANKQWLVSELNGSVLQLDKDFEDENQVLQKWFKKNKISAVLIRPDKYIFDAGNDPDALCASLKKQLNLYASTSTKQNIIQQT